MSLGKTTKDECISLAYNTNHCEPTDTISLETKTADSDLTNCSLIMAMAHVCFVTHPPRVTTSLGGQLYLTM